MQLRDFDYHLPPQLIAQAPLAERAASRLLVVDSIKNNYSDAQFADLDNLLDSGDLLVFNNTRVIPARLFGRKQSGGKIEVMVERVIDAKTLLAHIRSSKSPKPGMRLVLEEQIHCRMRERQDDLFVVYQQSDKTWLELLEQYGHVPLPPYIRRQDTAADRDRYQTVYARSPGAVAAPTAGLHFDEAMIQRLQQRGINSAYLTLHVGAGTFQPLRNDDIDSHIMHAERVEVSAAVCAAITKTRAEGGRIIAVGTTVVRALETAALGGSLEPLAGESRLFIRPGFQFEVVDAMITNFHLPRSTLLMLVSAFAGSELVPRAYAHAIEQEYRFFSYGDAMYIRNRAGQND